MRGWRGRFRRVAGAAGALAAVSALTMWGAAPASAGGPTSVLLTSPETTEAAGLYYSDERYTELERLLDSTGSGSAERPQGSDLTNSRQINVTWMLHDVTPFRQDQVFPEFGSERVWIRTSDLHDTVNGYWHRSPDPSRLRALLKELGVMGPVSPKGDRLGIPEALESEAVATGAGGGTDESAPRASSASADAGTNWWWTLPGAAAGAALALALRPPLARRWANREPREPGPRQQLLDA